MGALLTASIAACTLVAAWALLATRRRRDARLYLIAALAGLAAIALATEALRLEGDALGGSLPPAAALLAAGAALAALWIISRLPPARGLTGPAAHPPVGSASHESSTDEPARPDQQWQRVLLNATEDSMLLTDREGRILELNGPAARRLGRPAEELIGQGMLDVLSPGLAASRKEFIDEVVRSGSAVRMEEERDGFVFDNSFNPVFDGEGNVIQLAICARDITDRKQAEAERLELEAELRQAQKIDALGTLATGVAHECNNMLMAITSANELAQYALAEGHPALRELKTIEAACWQAGGVTRSLLTYASKHDVGTEPVRLRGVVDAFTSLVRPLLPAAIRLEQDLDGAADVWVRGDENQLAQVPMNLALNARDAMSDGGTLRIALRTEDPDPKRRGPRRAVLSVHDTGCGMSETVRHRIFEPFYSTRPRGQGTGLGLSVVYGIVADHSGEIDVETVLHQGATFTVRLPMCEPPMEEADDGRC